MKLKKVKMNKQARQLIEELIEAYIRQDIGWGFAEYGADADEMRALAEKKRGRRKGARLPCLDGR